MRAVDVVADAIAAAWANVEDENGTTMARFPSRHDVAAAVLDRLDDEGFLVLPPETAALLDQVADVVGLMADGVPVNGLVEVKL